MDDDELFDRNNDSRKCPHVEESDNLSRGENSATKSHSNLGRKRRKLKSNIFLANQGDGDLMNNEAVGGIIVSAGGSGFRGGDDNNGSGSDGSNNGRNSSYFGVAGGGGGCAGRYLVDRGGVVVVGGGGCSSSIDDEHDDSRSSTMGGIATISPRLIPATQQTLLTSTVKTASVTVTSLASNNNNNNNNNSNKSSTIITPTTSSLSSPIATPTAPNSPTIAATSSILTNSDWAGHDHTYDGDDRRRRRQLIGRNGLENLKAVAGVPQKAAAFLEEFTLTACSTDDEVRCDVLEYLPDMALFLSTDSDNYQLRSLISSHLLPTVAASLADHSTEVVKMAESALLTMLEHSLIGADYIENRIWPVIKGRLQQKPIMENTIGVLTVMYKMAPWLGCDQTERLLVPTLEQLSSDAEFPVRRVCASLYGDFCAVISTSKTESVLVPSFLRLCADSEFLVRKTCAETFMSVSCTVTLHTRRTQLAPVFARLLSDSVRWVQLAAFQSLGPFITTFAEPSITMLGYNTLGELVLKHPDGFEFRLNSCKVDYRYFTRDEMFALLVDGSGNNNNQQHPHVQQHQQLHNHSNNMQQPQRCFQQMNRQQDDKNNNHERRTQEQVNYNGGSSTLISENSSWDPDHEETKIYNQFQYWREPLPNINIEDGDSSIPTSNNQSYEEFDRSPSVIINSNNNNNNNNDDEEEEEDLANEKQQISPATQQQRHPQQQPQGIMSSLVRRLQDMSVYKDSNSSSATTAVEQPTQASTVDLVTTSCSPSEDDPVQQQSPLSSLSPLSSTPPPSSIQQQQQPVPSPQPLTPSPHQDIVPLELIKHFVSMSELGRNAGGEDLAGHCAYNLPAVALTLGPKHWDLLKPAYETLAADRQWKVRRIVASCIHELAVIVGEEVATQDLVPVFNGFIKDLDEVRIAALKHLAHFLKLLRPAGRNSFLPRLTEFLMTDYEWNWRFRQELAEQLLQVLGLFSPVDTCHHLSPVVMALLVDRVSDVRKVALQLATELVSHVSIDVTLLRSLLAELAQQFAHSARWNRRQTFALFCSRLVSEGVLSGDMFARDVLPHLLDLSWDRVPNVRLTVARALANDVIVQPYFSDYSSPHYEVLHSVLKRLQGDKDRDVRYFASLVPVMQTPYNPNVENQYNLVAIEENTEDGGTSTLMHLPQRPRQVLD